MRSKTWVACVSPPKRSSSGSSASASWSGSERQSQSGTSASGTRRRRRATPAFRKYFCASTSAATWLQVSGTAIPSRRNTTEPSGLRISETASRKAMAS